jgi:hypothetical protein
MCWDRWDEIWGAEGRESKLVVFPIPGSYIHIHRGRIPEFPFMFGVGVFGNPEIPFNLHLYKFVGKINKNYFKKMYFQLYFGKIARKISIFYIFLENARVVLNM